MAAITDIKRCLETYLDSYATGAGIRVSWEGVTFTPLEGETFLDPTFMPTAPVQKELTGVNTRDRVQGYYQINLVTKAGTGLNALYEQYDGLQGVFNRGTGLTYVNADIDTILVEINRFYMNDLDESNSPWMFIPVFIEWRSDILVG